MSGSNVVELPTATVARSTPAPNPWSWREVLGVDTEPRDGAVAFGIACLRIADPLITLGILLLLSRQFGLPSAGPAIALGVIAGLLVAHVFRDAAAAQPWYRDGYRGMANYILGSWMMVTGALFLLGAVTGYLDRYVNLPTLIWLLVTPLAIAAQHAGMRYALLRYLRAPGNKRRAIVIGATEVARHLTDALKSQAQGGIAIEGVFDDRSVSRIAYTDGPPLRGRMGDVSDYVKHHRIDVIYITLPMSQHERVLSLLDSLRDTTASIYFVPDLFVFDLIQGRIDGIAGLTVVAICESPFYGVKGVLKRFTDIVTAAAALSVGFPLLLLIALAVKLSSAGPILFKQRRYGLNGEEILVYKFRTMRVCEDGAHVLQATRKDPRVTAVGAFLRKTSLDELPQFINVLQGRMSVVGPRPHAVAHNELYRKLIKGYMVRHKVKPGITGLAQVSGLRGATEDVEHMRRRIECDLEYLRRWSLALDMQIVVRTALLLFRDKNAY